VTAHPFRAGLAAGLDIGGTKTMAVAVDARGALVGRARVATDARHADAVVESAVEALERLAGDVGTPVGAFEVVGAGVPGWVVPSTGTVRHAVNIGVGPEPVAIAERLRRATGVPTSVENDVNAAAFGASTVMGSSDLAYLSIGTGLAAGLISDGRLRRGAHGVAGEIGHLPVDPRGPACECGQRGCLETVASGAAIARRWPSDSGRPAADLFAAAAAGAPAAVALRAEVARHLATAVVILTLTVDPAVVVLGGGVAEAGVPLLEAVRVALAERARDSQLLASLDLGGRLRLVPDALPVGAIGAALLARQHLGDALPPAAVAGAGG